MCTKKSEQIETKLSENSSYETNSQTTQTLCIFQKWWKGKILVSTWVSGCEGNVHFF
jgi:hypothetical protein